MCTNVGCDAGNDEDVPERIDSLRAAAYAVAERSEAAARWQVGKGLCPGHLKVSNEAVLALRDAAEVLHGFADAPRRLES